MHLILFSSMTNILLENMNFYSGNTGLDTMGIIKVTTLDRSYLIFK